MILKIDGKQVKVPWLLSLIGDIILGAIAIAFLAAVMMAVGFLFGTLMLLMAPIVPLALYFRYKKKRQGQAFK